VRWLPAGAHTAAARHGGAGWARHRKRRATGQRALTNGDDGRPPPWPRGTYGAWLGRSAGWAAVDASPHAERLMRPRLAARTHDRTALAAGYRDGQSAPDAAVTRTVVEPQVRVVGAGRGRRQERCHGVAQSPVRGRAGRVVVVGRPAFGLVAAVDQGVGHREHGPSIWHARSGDSAQRLSAEIMVSWRPWCELVCLPVCGETHSSPGATRQRGQR
jgi:hypothetical protein